MTLPGSSEPAAFKRTSSALEVTLPQAARNSIGAAIILSGDKLSA
ncbi:hypothetical protein [Sphingobium lactosutens]|nr:hypothetical protein [Sphingobium lactosutens]